MARLRSVTNVTATGLAGDLYVKTSFGLVKADRIGGSLTVENSNGGIKATSVKGAADIKTSFSPVILNGVGGGVTVVNQNGSVEVTSTAIRPAGKCSGGISLRTSFAPIKIYVPDDAGFSVTARTSFGSVTSELPLTVTGGISAQSVTGKIGSGDCELSLSDTNGNIEILKTSKKK